MSGGRRQRRETRHPAHVQALVNSGAELPSCSTVPRPVAFQVHSQGDRGSCCAHGVTAAHEIVTGQRYCAEDVFEEAWDDEGRRTVGDRFSGALVRDCVQLLACRGQRPVGRGEGYARRRFVPVNPGDVRETKLRLLGGAPVVAGLNRFGDFYETRSGDLTLASTALDQDPEWHCVVLVGYTDCPGAEGGGWFDLVNSWGTGWGREGFGRMSFRLYQQHCYEAFAPVMLADTPQTSVSAVRPIKRLKRADSNAAVTPANHVRRSWRNRAPSLPAGALSWTSVSPPPFDDFNACWSFLAGQSGVLPGPRVQTTQSNCVHFSCWTAIECLRGQPIQKPAAIFRVAQKDDGLALISFYEQDRVVRALAAHGVAKTVLDVRTKGPEVAQSALAGGGRVLLLGLTINMFDHDVTHVRDRRAKRGGQLCMLAHCVACVGYVTVASKCYFVLRDTQPVDLLGFGDSGLSLVAVEALSGEGAELVQLTACE